MGAVGPSEEEDEDDEPSLSIISTMAKDSLMRGAMIACCSFRFFLVYVFVFALSIPDFYGCVSIDRGCEKVYVWSDPQHFLFTLGALLAPASRLRPDRQI